MTLPIRLSQSLSSKCSSVARTSLTASMTALSALKAMSAEPVQAGDTQNHALQATSAQLALDIPSFAHQAGIAKVKVKERLSRQNAQKNSIALQEPRYPFPAMPPPSALKSLPAPKLEA